MKKLFTLFAAALVAVAVNAATTSVSAGVNTLRAAVQDANAGDVLELATGTYYEEGNFDMKKDLTIKAAEGAKPVIANRYYFRVEGGAAITFQGLKFDGAGWRDGNADPIGAYNHCVRPYDAATGNEVVTFEDCEFTSYPSYVIYTQRDVRRWNSITIRNCAFYNNDRCVIRIDEDGGNHTKQSCNSLTVENSTFAGNIEDVIYYNAPDAEYTTSLTMDYCTFYNNSKRAVNWQKSENLAVSNCIFAQPSTNTYKSVECVGGTIKNCLSYNTAGYSSAATSISNSTGDPKFADAENGDFTLSAGSRALEYAGKAVDGTTDSILNLGDPLWVPEPRTLYCEMTQSWWTVDGAAIGCYAWNGADANKVENAAYPGVRMTPVANEDGVWTIQLSRKYDNVIFTRMNPSDQGDQDWGYKTYDLALPAQWDYYTITATSAPGDKKAAGTWSKLNPTLENGWYLIGTFDGVEEKTFETLTAEKLFVVNPANANEYIVTANLKEGDKFKAAYVYYDQINSYKPNGVGDEYVIDEWHTGVKTIVFNETYQDSWGGYFFIEANEPVVTYSDFEIDLCQGQLGTDNNNPNNKYLAINGEDYTYTDDMPIAYNAYLTNAKYNGNQHGYVDLVATIPVVAGNYKITIGNCQYNSKNGAVKNADGSETLNLIDKNGQTITAIETPANCYDPETAENVTSVWFVAEADQTIQIVCPQYAPYIKVEQVAEVPAAVTVYTVTYMNAEGATGVVPAALNEVTLNTVITLPYNFSMYKEGYTLGAWSDGDDTYAPGANYTVTKDVTFVAIFDDNKASLANRAEPVTIKWEFSQSKGVAPINVNGATTFTVAQATIGDQTIDVQLPIDATAGKFVNSSNSWTQINPGVIFYIPSAKGAVITYKQYDAGTTTTPEINVTEEGDTYELVAAGTSGQLYYEYVQVVLPASTATAISTIEAGEKAVKMIENGQIVILKNGVKYNVLGALIK